MVAHISGKLPHVIVIGGMGQIKPRIFMQTIRQFDHYFNWHTTRTIRTTPISLLNTRAICPMLHWITRNTRHPHKTNGAEILHKIQIIGIK